MKLILNNFELEISTDEVFTCHPRDIEELIRMLVKVDREIDKATENIAENWILHIISKLNKAGDYDWE